MQKSTALNYIKSANELTEKKDYHRALDLYMKAFEACPNDKDIILSAVNGLININAKEEAFDLMQQSVSIISTDTHLLSLLSKLALDIGLPEIAEKFQLFVISLEPENSENYATYINCLLYQEKFDLALEKAQEFLQIFPESGLLWSALSTIAHMHLKQHNEGELFINEALRLEPKNPSILAKKASYLLLGQDTADLYKKALKTDEHNAEYRIGLAFSQLAMGQFKEGWKNYEYRFDLQSIGKNIEYTHQYQRWNGQSLAGKSILVTAEQGIGDEIFFAITFKKLIDKAEKVYIGCDPRLVSIFKRSFPKANVIPFEDDTFMGHVRRRFPAIEDQKTSIDYAVPMGSLFRYFWKSDKDIASFAKPYLTYDNQRFTEMYDKYHQYVKNFKIGISWRSGKQALDRKDMYLRLENVLKIMENSDIQFFNLQYDLTDEEAKILKDAAGDRFIIDDCDLKQDIESNIALMFNMDIILGPAISTQMLAMALGRHTIITHQGVPWWRFGNNHTGPIEFASNARFIKLNEIDGVQQYEPIQNYFTHLKLNHRYFKENSVIS